MTRIVLFGFIGSLLLAAPGAAEEPNILVSAERLASERAVEQPESSQMRHRSDARTWAGIAMLGGGAVLAAHAATSTCATTSLASAVFDTQTCGQAWTKVGAGIGLAVAGTLLATVWSDVPVANNLSVSPMPGGARVGASFGF